MLEAIFQSVGVLPHYNENALPIVGILSGLLSVFAFAPYVRDTLAGRTRPQRASWFIWSVLGCIALSSQVYEGATSSLWFIAIQTGGTILVFGLAISRGTGSFINAGDACMLIAAAIGLALWAVTDTTAYALGIIILVSSIGGCATIKKAYQDPGSETTTTWTISCAASALAILAIEDLSWILLVYPMYLFTLYCAIIAATTTGRARKPQLGMAPIFWSNETRI